jgi:hypothetical protein
MTRIDVFAAVNTVLFLILVAFRYYAKFVEYRGPAHIEEFLVYALLLLCGIALLWVGFRRHRFDLGLLLLLQVGILMHFGGAFVQWDGGRLYEAHLLGLRYDKYVHLVNAFGATYLMSRLFQFQRIALDWINRIVLVMTVLGLGAMVELVEYGVMVTLPANGVGSYHNNMQDLIANLAGALGFLAFQPHLARGRGRLLSGGRRARLRLRFSPRSEALAEAAPPSPPHPPPPRPLPRPPASLSRRSPPAPSSR